MNTHKDNPYVGPRAFSVADRERFFGREQEARDLFSLIVAERLVLFYAQSGAGKSSLLQARVTPRLAESGYLVLPVGRVSGQMPDEAGEVDNVFVYNLERNLDKTGSDPSRFAHLNLSSFLQGLTSEDGLHWYYDDYTAEEPDTQGAQQPISVLVIDQFEELITNFPERWRDREDFFRQLQHAQDEDSSLWIVLALREDFVAALDPYIPLMRNRLRARFHMQRMGYDAALQAVSRPAAVYGRPFASGVVEQLVDNLRQIRVEGGIATRAGQFVEPVQLQVVCYQLWERTTGKNEPEITAEDLARFGDVDRALASFYEQALAEIPDHLGVPQSVLRDWFDRQLITEAGTRGIVYQGDTQTAGLANDAVIALANRYLLRAEARAGGTWYELVHDRFIDPIREANRQWWERQSPLIRDARDWDQGGRGNDALLYTGKRLAEAEKIAQDLASDPLVATFLNASRELDRQKREKAEARKRELEAAQALAEERRRNASVLRRRAYASLFIAGIAIAFAGVAYKYYIDAESEKKRTEQALYEANSHEARFLTELARQANQVGDPAVAALLAREIIEKDQELVDAPWLVDARKQLTDAVAKPWPRFVLETKGSISEAAFNPDGTELMAQVGRRVSVWNLESGVKNDYPEDYKQGDFAQLFYGDWGAWLLEQKRNDQMQLRDPEGKQQTVALNVNIPRFRKGVISPGGQRLVTLKRFYPTPTRRISQDIPTLWDLTTGQKIANLISGMEENVYNVAFSPDGKRIVTTSSVGTQIWDAGSGEKQLPIGKGEQGKILYAVFSPEQDDLLLTRSEAGEILFWNATTGERLGSLGRESEGEDEALEIIKEQSVFFSPDGKRIATAMEDKTVRIWDTQQRSEPKILKVHDERILHLAFSPDSKQLLVTSADGTASLWDVEKGERLLELRGHNKAVKYVAFSWDGAQAITVSDDRTLRVWDLTVGHGSLEGHAAVIRHASFSPDGNQVLTLAKDGTARMWNGARGWEFIPLLEEQTRGLSKSRVRRAILNPDGSRLFIDSAKTVHILDVATGQQVIDLRRSGGSFPVMSPDGTRIAFRDKFRPVVQLYDATTGSQLMQLRGYKKRIGYVTFSPDSKRLLTASAGGAAKVWDVLTGRVISALKGHKADIRHASLSPDGARVVTASRDKTVRLWDTQTGKEIHLLDGHEGDVFHAAFSPDGTRLATASNDKTARVWNLLSGKSISVLKGHKKAVLRAIFSPDGNRIMTSSRDGSAQLWEVESGERIGPLCDGKKPAKSIIFSQDAERVVVLESNQIHICEVQAGKQRITLAGNKGITQRVGFSQDGRRVVAISHTGSVQVWDAESGDNLLTMETQEFSILKAAFTPNKARILITADDNTARVLDANTGHEVAPPIRHKVPLIHAAINPDGTRVVTASKDGKVYLWDADSGNEIYVLEGHEGNVFHAAFSPDGTRVVTSSKDDTARVWDTESGQVAHVLKGHEGDVHQAVFSPDGTHVVTVSVDGTMRVWNTESGLEIHQLEGHKRGVNQVSFSPDGTHIVANLRDYTTHLWNLTTTGETPEDNILMGTRRERLLHVGFTPDSARLITISSRGIVKLWDAGKGKEIMILYKPTVDGAIADADISPDGSQMIQVKGRVASVHNLFLDTESLIASVKERLPYVSSGYGFKPAVLSEAKRELYAPPEFAEEWLELTLKHANVGKVKQAFEAVEKALATKPGIEIKAEQWNGLCWNGALQVPEDWEPILKACDHAVDTARKADDKKMLASTQDSRAAALVLSGNIQGAIADFKTSVVLRKGLIETGELKSSSYSQRIRKREALISELEELKDLEEGEKSIDSKHLIRKLRYQ